MGGGLFLFFLNYIITFSFSPSSNIFAHQVDSYLLESTPPLIDSDIIYTYIPTVNSYTRFAFISLLLHLNHLFFHPPYFNIYKLSFVIYHYGFKSSSFRCRKYR
ncbi:hypothetical protein EYC80_008285 [Monilinia laxa]|uniref:LAGLIDADG endonuclease n=1 Tax=Monilinia laxa TaxID=61186 RepID=A0A5N6JVT0_MONLA|nr:hypothetical protein EYC80_008285 [Monilinia laxa]